MLLFLAFDFLFRNLHQRFTFFREHHVALESRATLLQLVWRVSFDCLVVRAKTLRSQHRGVKRAAAIDALTSATAAPFLLLGRLIGFAGDG